VIARLASIARRTATIAAERPRAAVWTLLALTAALFAFGVAAVAAENVDRWTSDHRGGAASMVVYLDENLGETRAKELVAELAAIPGIEHVELVSSAESARRLEQALGISHRGGLGVVPMPPASGDAPDASSIDATANPDAALLAGVDLASLPPSVEVTLAPGVRDVVAMSPTVRALRGAPGVADVIVSDETEDRTAGVAATIRTVAWAGAALFGGLAVVIALAAVRVRLERTRREHEVAHLLGASPTFFAVPTALAGAVFAIVASLIAAVAVWLVVDLTGGSVEQSLTAALGPIQVALPSVAEIALFVVGGGMLGMIGGGLAGAARAR
jgi:cell division transport system permease protein